MVDNHELSKHKYIHIARIFHGKIYIERFPVVYINMNYVYYTVGDHESLRYVFTSDVLDSLKDTLQQNFNTGRALTQGFSNKGFWKVSDDDSIDINEFFRTLVAEDRKRSAGKELKEAKDKVKNLEKELKEAQFRLCQLENDNKEIENETT